MTNSSWTRLAVTTSSALLLAGCLGSGSNDAAGAGAGSSKLDNGISQTTFVPHTNIAPVISGTAPAQVLQGQSYDFRPTASDKEDDTLAFSITNRPAWATFDAATGRLSGTPAAADAGQYAGIVISVSDGHSTVALPAFSVTVTQLATGQVTLSWSAPSQNTDGSALTNLRGYRIYYGRSATTLDQTIVIDTTGITSRVIDSLTPATWYFSMTSVNTSGVESARTNVVSKAVGG